jgi:hypothetical protein
MKFTAYEAEGIRPFVAKIAWFREGVRQVAAQP